MVRFIVLSTHRSGSTFLCRSLNSAHRIRCDGEYFWWGHDKSFEAFAAYVLDGAPFCFQNADRQYVIRQFLDVVCEGNPSLDAVGFKLHYSQLEEYPEILTWMQEHSVRVIHLLRKNILKRLVSWIVKTKCGYSTSTTPTPQAKIRLDCDCLIPLLEDMDVQLAYYRNMFLDQCTCLEIFYEDFRDFRKRETDRVEAFLDVGPLGDLTSNTVKINSEYLSDAIVNYDDVVATLSQTRFADFLDPYPANDLVQR